MKQFYLLLSLILVFTACNNKNIVLNKSINTKQDIYLQKEEKIFDIFGKTNTSEDESLSDNKNFKIAIVFPSKIVGKYGNSTISTIMGYLLYSKSKFEIESFDSEDEEIDSINNIFAKIKEKGYTKIIGLFTENSLPIISNISQINNMEIYFPLLEKPNSFALNKNFIFGSISYSKQMKKLLTLSMGNNAQVYQDSNIGYKLKDIYESLVDNVIVNQNIKQTNNNFKNIVTNENLKHTTLMINTPIVKSSIILSQLYAYETQNAAILSTQLNYNPLLISLTQYEDRLNLILANSIEDTNNNLTEILTLLDTDIKYNWVNYSSLVGINYLYSRNKNQLIKNNVIDNEVIYNTNLFYSTQSGFKKLELN